jgi:hypothetical protein
MAIKAILLHLALAPAIVAQTQPAPAKPADREPACTHSRQCGGAPRYCLMPFSPPQEGPGAPAAPQPRLAVCVDATGFADCDPRAAGARCGRSGVCLVRGPECSVPTGYEGQRPCGYCMELVWA